MRIGVPKGQKFTQKLASVNITPTQCDLMQRIKARGCKTKSILIFSWITRYFYAKGQVFLRDEGKADIKRAVRNNTLIDTA